MRSVTGIGVAIENLYARLFIYSTIDSPRGFVRVFLNYASKRNDFKRYEADAGRRYTALYLIPSVDVLDISKNASVNMCIFL